MTTSQTAMLRVIEMFLFMIKHHDERGDGDLAAGVGEALRLALAQYDRMELGSDVMVDEARAVVAARQGEFAMARRTLRVSNGVASANRYVRISRALFSRMWRASLDTPDHVHRRPVIGSTSAGPRS